MARIGIKDVGVSFNFQVTNYQGCDGYPAALVSDVVHVTDLNGHQYFLPNSRWVRDEEDGFSSPVRCYSSALRVASRVRAQGDIDPEFWIQVDPQQPSLEEKFEQYAFEDQMERSGYLIG